MRCLGAACAPAVLAAGLLCSAPQACAAIPAWTTYHHDGARSGIDPDSTSPLPPARRWQTELDGGVWGEPLVYGPYVYVATQNDTIYAIETATGKVHWEAHLGTAVPSEELPCGDIEPTVGITATPVIDPTTNTIYAVADNWEGTRPTIRHKLYALDLDTGALRASFPRDVDPPFPTGGEPRNQLQRAGLALDAGNVVIGYGGNDGDCNTYWGWLVAAPESGAGPLQTFQVDSGAGHDQGAIWGAGNAPAVDGAGNVYTATGNGSSGSTFDNGDAVLKLNSGLLLLEWWAPEEWETLDKNDEDLGSSGPILLPDNLVFEVGKRGNEAVLLRGGAFGGVAGAAAATFEACSGSGSWGGGIYVPASAEAGTLYVNCDNGLHATTVTELASAHPRTMAAAHWHVNGNAVGPPIFAGGLVWVASWTNGTLYGLNPVSGEVSFEEALGGFEHFATPSAGGGRLFVANQRQLTALDIAVPPAPTSTSTSLAAPGATERGKPVTLTATVSPVPDSGIVTFTDVGTQIAGCTEVRVSLASGGKASCQASFSQIGAHTLVASYSGDSYYTPSSSPLVTLQVTAGPGSALGLLSALKESHKRWREGRARPRISAVRARATSAGRHGKHRHRGAPVGTTFTFMLSEPSPIAFSFKQSLPGRRVGTRCVAIFKHKPLTHARGRSCKRMVTAATLKFTGHRGLNSVHFEGRVSRRKILRPGSYTLVVVAGGAFTEPVAQRVSFTIVKG